MGFRNRYLIHMLFFDDDFSNKCEKMRSFPRIRSHLLNKSLTETFFVYNNTGEWIEQKKLKNLVFEKIHLKLKTFFSVIGNALRKRNIDWNNCITIGVDKTNLKKKIGITQ